MSTGPIWPVVVASILLVAILLVACMAFLVFRGHPEPLSRRLGSSEELAFRSPGTAEAHRLPSLSEKGDLALSVIIPAFNEASRLPGMLDDCLAFLSPRHDTVSFEIIVVDDGSADETTSVALKYGERRMKREMDTLRVVRLERNRGKGAAVTHGMLHARGRLLLFVDADGASRFSDLALLEDSISTLQKRTGPAIAVGSRAHMVNSDAVIQRSWLRNLLMRSFHFYLQLLGVTRVKDTQCGFKLFSREAAQLIFPSLHTAGWIFDIEILLVAEHLHIPVVEVPITWREIVGSKMSLALASIQMALDLLTIRLNYATGRWQLHT